MIQPGYHHALLPVPSVFCIKKEQAALVYPLLLSYLSYGAVTLEEVTPPLNIAFQVCSEISGKADGFMEFVAGRSEDDSRPSFGKARF